MKTEKPWGTTECLLKTPLIEVHRIEVRPHMCCSWHKHERKWNAFVLIHGEMDIEHEAGEYAGIVNLRSRVGNFYTVPPGEHHRFVTREERAVALEFYYPAELSEDIIRRDVGGPLTEEMRHEERFQVARAFPPVQGSGGTRPGDEASIDRPGGYAQGRHQPENEAGGQARREDVLTRPWSTLRLSWAEPDPGELGT